jgi:2-methylcitrate dehydratase PrpD
MKTVERNLCTELITLSREVANSTATNCQCFARICLLDWLAVSIAGTNSPIVGQLLADSKSRPAHGRFQLVGRSEKLGLFDSILVNGTAGHVLDYDDGLPPMGGHPGAVIFPALIALTEDTGATWERFHRAVVTGYEVAGRIGLMMGPDHYERGFHSTSTIGAIASAAACSSFMSLSDDQALAAYGLAGTRSGGLKASFGTDAKPLHAGWAALTGLTAAKWASLGITASHDILGHDQGWGHAGTDVFNPGSGLKQFENPLINETKFKHFAACGVTHGAIRAALRISENKDRGEINSINIEVAAAAAKICNQPKPRNGAELKFSIPGVVAMSLLGIDPADHSAYSETVCRQREFRQLLSKIEVVFVEGRPIGPTRMSVRYSSGEHIVVEEQGSQADDCITSAAAVTKKFRSLVTQTLGKRRAKSMAASILDASAPDIAKLLRQTTPMRAGTLPT